MPESIESLKARKARCKFNPTLNPVDGRFWSKTKRGPGRSPKDSRHGHGGAISLSARLQKQIRRRIRNEIKRKEAEGYQVIRERDLR